MAPQTHHSRRLPPAPKAIQKGVPLKHLLGPKAVDGLAHNLADTYQGRNLK
jgi:hypothetical protein